ncbi:MAG TPA: S-layer homology domain-containing protein [Gemmataceae bacterium]
MAFRAGDRDGTFRPDQPITRGEVVQMLYRALAGRCPD